MKEKNIFYAVLISFVFLFGYSIFISKFAPQAQKPAQIQEKAMLDNKEYSSYADPLSKETAVEDLEQEKNLPQARIGSFIVTYSPLGGYIKKIHIISYKEDLLYRNIGFITDDKNEEFTSQIEGNKLIFLGQNNKRKEYLFDRYTITLKLSPSSITPVLLFSNKLIPSMLEQRYQELFYSQKGILYRNAFKKVKGDTKDDIEFIGLRDIYFCISLIKNTEKSIKWAQDNNTIYVFSPPAINEAALYAGPQIKKELQPFGLEGVIHYGFFHVIGMSMLKLLYFFYFITKNWGISIILLAVAIYFVLFPFTMKSTKAMKRMQDLQPEIEDLKKQYKDNPQKMNKEMLTLYRKHKVNPIGGCLPLLFQFPVFIALYQVLLRCIELKGAKFLWIQDLSLPDKAFTLPFTIPFLGNHINILPLLIVIISLVQQKFTTSAVSSSEQKKMALFFSVFIGVIFYKFPACLVLYWFVQNLLTLFYQMRLSQNKN